MKPYRFLSATAITGITLAAVVVLSTCTTGAASKSRELQITRDATGKVTVSWDGHGVLKQASGINGKFKPVRARGRSHTTEPVAEQMIYMIDSAQSPVYSVNAVGYVNLQLPPGLSLICNPLRNIDNTVETLFSVQIQGGLPDGLQVYKYVSSVGYEVSVFDGVQWSNPDMDLPPGTGFFVDNPTSTTAVNTFVGEVLEGTLINHLPAGFSLEASLIPQAGPLTFLHGIPGEDGDIIRFYVNDGMGGGDYITSTFSGAEGSWVPDLDLAVGQGFVSERENAADWIRIFDVTP